MRADHAVELADLPDHREGRAGARSRLHGRAQAERAVAAQRAAVRGSDCRCGRARRRLQSRERQRRNRGGRACVAPGGRHGVDHRIDAGRRAGGAGGRHHRQARRAGAGRQVAEYRVAGCGPVACDPARRGRRVPQHGAVVQRADPHDRAARRARRGGGAGRRGDAGTRRRRSVRRRNHARAAGQSRAVRPRCTDDRRGHRRTRETDRWRPRPTRGARPRLLCAADDFLRRAHRHGDRAAGDLRPGARDPAVRHRRRSGRHRERHGLRARRACARHRQGTRPRGGRPHPGGAGASELPGLGSAGAVRRVQAVGQRPRVRDRRDGGIHGDQVDRRLLRLTQPPLATRAGMTAASPLLSEGA
ncbi:hypothetical protein F01_421100 [Burkholderia cenocepacia]|nr:hypothetical protein F01_421100 [Burkholderia cenocepacia]